MQLAEKKLKVNFTISFKLAHKVGEVQYYYVRHKIDLYKL